jgi:pyruvate dehydrogenase E1 component alpha subunit
LIEAKTYRFRGHYEGDPQVYRLPGEMEAWKKRDPIPAFRKQLLAANIFDESQIVELEASVHSELDEAVTFAVDSPMPAVEDALKGVYADTHEGLVF